VASPLFADAFHGGAFALENHVNYIYHSDRDLTRDETLGVAAMFNSALLDIYFRAVSGNTQVNAAEIRQLPFPGLDLVARIGREVSKKGTADRTALEEAILGILNINGQVRAFLAPRENQRSIRGARRVGAA
jgi:adenine-specific DNA-methyltransferase